MEVDTCLLGHKQCRYNPWYLGLDLLAEHLQDTSGF